MLNARARFIYDFNIFEVIKFGQSLLEYFICSFLVPHWVLDFLFVLFAGEAGNREAAVSASRFHCCNGN